MSRSVFIYTPSLKFGGAEKALVTLANCLSGANYHVTYCYSEIGELSKELLHNIPQVNIEKARMLSSVFPLYKTLTKHKPDVIVTTLVHCNIMLLLIGFIYNLFNSHQVKVIVRETTNISLRLEQMGWAKRFVFKSLMRVCYPRAKAVVFPNKSLKVKFESYFRLKMNNGVVIYNSSPSKLNITENKQEISFSPEEEITLLSVGRLTKTKRVEDLLHALAQLQSKHNIKVDIVGAGPEEASLKCLAKRLNVSGFVSFKGFLKEPFANYNPTNTIFVLTSELEGMPNSLIEALCSGFSCISADCDFGPKEIFDCFMIGGQWLYVPSNVNQLISCIHNLVFECHPYIVDFTASGQQFSDISYLSSYKNIL
jgi:glycosyltransferase involved in cell wall biosynthesis